jgi:hypothetical protein
VAPVSDHSTIVASSQARFAIQMEGTQTNRFSVIVHVFGHNQPIADSRKPDSEGLEEILWGQNLSWRPVGDDPSRK